MNPVIGSREELLTAVGQMFASQQHLLPMSQPLFALYAQREHETHTVFIRLDRPAIRQ